MSVGDNTDFKTKRGKNYKNDTCQETGKYTYQVTPIFTVDLIQCLT